MLLTTQFAEAQKATIVDHNNNVLDTTLQQTGQSVNPADSLALVAFYHHTKGDTWINNSGWLVDMVEFWHGIEQVTNVGDAQNPDWRVTRIEMSSNNTVTSTIPPELFDLEYLNRLRLVDNFFVGSFPPEIANADRLVSVRFRSQFMAAEVPWASFADMESLTQIDTRDDLYFGEIDPIITNTKLVIFEFIDHFLSGQVPEDWTTLERLDITENLFTGRIPQLDNIERLVYYRVSDNPFDPGPIPDWVQQHSETLRRFKINNTNRTGTVPEWITDMIAMEELIFGEVESFVDVWGRTQGGTVGDLGGTLPDLSVLPNVDRLYIYGPHFDGEWPNWLGNMPSLERFRAENTHYEGSLPANLGNVSTLQWLHIMNNPNITGSIPAQWQQLSNLRIFVLQNLPNFEPNGMFEWFGSFWTNIDHISLEGINLEGQIPQQWANMTPITTLSLNNNAGITGGVPSWLQQDDQNVSLDLSYTGIDVGSTIPDWLNNRADLSHLGLAGLGLEGDIPLLLLLGDRRPSRLSHINLADNNLTGSIPSEFGNLVTLSHLDLSNNQFSGEIPPELADAGRLTSDRTLWTYLDVSGNENLTGSLPIALTHASNMRVMKYDGTGICEPNDPQFMVWLEETIPANSDLQFPSTYVEVSRTEQSCATTSIPVEHAHVFRLQQNYPNPFNPATTIKYEVPNDVHVTLTVYNILGQRIATLVDETLSAGSHQVQFDATHLSSGSYIYRLEAGERVLNKTMMLIK